MKVTKKKTFEGLRFIFQDITFYAVGKPPDNYYYDFGRIPLGANACFDILEKTRFIWALYELFSFTSNKDSKVLQLPVQVLEELMTLFSDYEEFDLSHWALHHDTLNDLDFQECKYTIDETTKDLIVKTNSTTLIVPPPYENVIDAEGEDFYIDKKGKSKAKKISFLKNEGSPIIFMSVEQEKVNTKRNDNLINEMLSIFEKHDVDIKSCGELLEYYFRIEKK